MIAVENMGFSRIKNIKINKNFKKFKQLLNSQNKQKQLLPFVFNKIQNQNISTKSVSAKLTIKETTKLDVFNLISTKFVCKNNLTV